MSILIICIGFICGVFVLRIIIICLGLLTLLHFKNLVPFLPSLFLIQF